MAIVTIDAGSRQTAGSIIMESWKHGIEVEKLYGNQLELTCAHDDKLNRVLSRFADIKVLHTELIKEVAE
jgi:hypothetical protein